MRTLRLGALAVPCLLAALGAGSPLGLPAVADTGPERTEVVLRALPTITDGKGVVRLRTRLAGDVALCTGTLRLKVVDLAEDEVVADRERPVAKVRRFPLTLEPGRHRVVGSYELGDRDPCAVSRDVRRVRVRD